MKLYNGGYKDWVKSGLPAKVIDALPEIDIRFVDADELIKLAESELVTLLDLRVHGGDGRFPEIDCPSVAMDLDDLVDKESRARLPASGVIVTITETGNRDELAARVLARYGIRNVSGLRHGMRGWIKGGHPVR